MGLSEWRPRASSSGYYRAVGGLRNLGLPLPLTGNLGRGREAWVSPEHWEEARTLCWHVGTSGYPQNHRRTRARKLLRLHEWVAEKLGLVRGPKQFFDHRDRNKLDARIGNLRVAAGWDNAANRAGNPRKLPRGVGYFKPAKLYQAYINHGGQRIALGYAKTPEEAHVKRITAEYRYYGCRLPESVGVAS